MMTEISSIEPLRSASHPFLDSSTKRMLIDGQWVESTSGKYFETRNPANGKVLTRVAEAGAEDIDLAVRAARRAFQGAWRKIKPSDRQRLLLRLAELIEHNADELALLEVLDSGMPIAMARTALVPRAAEQVRYYAGWATKIHGETIDNSAPGDFHTYTLREPVGVVGAIVPWNSPLMIAIWKLAPLSPQDVPLFSNRLSRLLFQLFVLEN